MQLLQEIKFSYATVKLFSNELIRIEIFGDMIISGEQAKEMNDAIGVLSKGKESMIMIFADELTSFSREAQEFSASEEGLRYTIGDALVVKSVAQRITANLYLMMNRPKKPSRIFSSEKNALHWLEALKCNLVPA
jgi:UDP-N-acetylmuramyl pentapeptide synthase